MIPEESAVPAEAEAEWNLRLVSAAHPLPEDFTAPELTQLRNHQAIDKRAYPALQQMMDDARAAGLQPLICSSYAPAPHRSDYFRTRQTPWQSRVSPRKRPSLWLPSGSPAPAPASMRPALRWIIHEPTDICKKAS